MKDLFFLDTMITPKIITFIYWLGLLGAVGGGLGQMFSSTGSVVVGLLTIVFGALAARIWSELLIVLFKINENLQIIAKKDQM